MFRTTIKGIAAHKVRLLTTTLAVMLGVAFMAGTLVLTDTVGRTFDDLMADTSAGTDAVVRSSTVIESEMGDQRGTVDEAVVAQVAAVDGVAVAQGEVSGAAQIIGSDGDVLGAANTPTLAGSWSDEPELNAYTLVEGDAPDAADEVVIDRGSFTDGGFAVGDTIGVLTPAGAKDMTLTGVVSFGDSDSPAGASVALFDLPTAQQLLGQEGQLSQIAVVADDGVSQEQVAEGITASLASSSGAAGSGPGVEAITGDAYTEELQSDIQQSLSFFNTFLLVFAAIALFVGSFIIANTFSIIVAQRTRELALLRAVGASRRQVLGSVLLEALTVGIVASAMGLVAGIGVATGLQALLGALGLDIPASGTVVATSTVVLSFVVGVGITLVSATFPAIRASKVPPIAALRDVALDRSNASIPRLAGGLLLAVLGGLSLAVGLFGEGDNRLASVGAGAVAIILAVALLGPAIAAPISRLLGWPVAQVRGVSGRLARENAARNPRRTSATAAALMIGVSLVGAITIVAASTKASVDEIIEDAFAGDLVVATEGFASTGFSPELAAQLDGLPETDEVVAVRMGPVEVDGTGTFAIAADTASSESVVDLGVTEGSYDTMGAGQVAVAATAAEDNGWTVGDTVTMTFAETGPQELEIVALYENDELGGEYVVDLATWEANVSTQLDAQVFMTLADGVGIEDGRAAVESLTAAYPSTSVQDIDEYRKAQTAPIDQILTLIYALLALAVIIALLGIANTLALSVLERTRELGLLRAVGMSRRQLRSTVRWESVLIALLGTVLGLTIGLGFGSALVTALQSEGLTTFVVPAPQLVVITVLAAGAGMLAAARPASRAAKLDILGAIAEG